MIKVTRLDQSQLYLNAEFIQSVESTPDTHIVLVNGHSYVVRESDEEVVARIIDYRHAVGGADAGSGRTVLHLVSNSPTVMSKPSACTRPGTRWCGAC